MQTILDPVQELGANMVAITPQLPAKSVEMITKQSLGFDILTDPGNDYAARLGLRFDLPLELQSIYRGFGIDLPASNGEASWTLPIPARIVIAKDGIVQTVDADPDYTQRPEPEKTLAELRALTN